MRARSHRLWQTIWHVIDEYLLPGSRSEAWREKVLVALEHVQMFFTRVPNSKKKKHRLLRQILPALACLIVGFFLFLPAHQMARAQGTSATQTSSITYPAGPQKRKPPSNCSATSNQNSDTLTGLPLPDTNGNTLCPVKISDTCSVSATSLTGGDWLFNNPASGSLLVQTENLTPDLEQDWKYVLGLALALLAIPFALAGYEIMLGTVSSHYAGAVEIISRIVVIALVVALSYTLINFLIQLEVSISGGLYQALGSPSSTNSQSIAVPVSSWCVNAQNFFGNMFNLTIYGLQNVSGTPKGVDYAQSEYATTIAVIHDLPKDILTLLTILLVVQLLIRLGLLNFYIILSPLAIICGSLPGDIGPGAARGWVRGLLALLFVQLLQLLALGLGRQVFPIALTSGGDWFNQAMNTLLPVVIMLITLNIPRLFNVSSVSMLSTLSSSIGGAMSGVILIVRGL